MSKEYLKNNWRKLDNTAKIFSLDDKRNTNTFRYSVILKEDIDKYLLEKALKKTLNNYLAFKVKFVPGLFWNYFELNPKEPIIKEENTIPCKPINFKKNNDYLFKVSYYKKKINLDVFHALTDGAGAIKLLKSIIYNYLELKNNIPSIESTSNSTINYQDEYLKNYDPSLKINLSYTKAYKIPGKRDKNINNTYHYTIDIKEIKNICKKYNVTITEYITAIYIYAMYLSIYDKTEEKEIVITVPIDLRKYYNTDTLSNFFTCMNINPKILEKNLTTFDEILEEVHKQFQEKLSIDKVKNYLTKDVKLGINLPVRLAPLFIKKLFIKYFGAIVNKGTTSTISNVGIMDIDEKYKKHIDNIYALVLPGRIQKIKCTMCSFDKKLNITINSNMDDIKFEKTFLKLLNNNFKNIKIETNNTNFIK